MSFFYGIKAANKADALAQHEIKLAEVVAQQPVHAVDAPQITATVTAYLDQLADDDDRDVSLSVNGTIWRENDATRSVGVGVNCGLVDRAPAA